MLKVTYSNWHSSNHRERYFSSSYISGVSNLGTYEFFNVLVHRIIGLDESCILGISKTSTNTVFYCGWHPYVSWLENCYIYMRILFQGNSESYESWKLWNHHKIAYNTGNLYVWCSILTSITTTKLLFLPGNNQVSISIFFWEHFYMRICFLVNCQKYQCLKQ